VNRSSRWRRVASPILIAAAMLLLAVGELALYGSYNLFDSDRFADRAVGGSTPTRSAPWWAPAWPTGSSRGTPT